MYCGLRKEFVAKRERGEHPRHLVYQQCGLEATALINRGNLVRIGRDATYRPSNTRNLGRIKGGSGG